MIPIEEHDLVRLKQEILGKACGGVCEGAGSLLAEGVFKDCTCVAEFARCKKLLQAGIPRKYWDFDLSYLIDAFAKENKVSLNIIKQYCSSLPEMVHSGTGLYIQGTRGLAKSSLGYYILREGIRQNFLVCAIRMSKLTKMLFDAIRDPEKADLLKRIQSTSQILMIDEIEKDYRVSDTSTFSGTQVNEFFGEVYDRRVSLIVTSELPKKDLAGIHAGNIIDRLEELVDIILVGTSFRKQDDALRRILQAKDA